LKMFVDFVKGSMQMLPFWMAVKWAEKLARAARDKISVLRRQVAESGTATQRALHSWDRAGTTLPNDDQLTVLHLPWSHPTFLLAP